MTGSPGEPGRVDRSGRVFVVGSDPAMIPHRPPETSKPADARERSSTWRYSVRGIPGALYMVATEKIGSDEALQILAQHFGIENVLALEGGAT